MPKMSHEDDGGLIYGLEFQCRSLCAVQLAEEVDRIRFLVGTQGSKVTNQVHLVELEEETGALAKTLYSHPEGEIWQIESGFPGHVFATRHSRVDPGAAGAAGAPGCPVKADLWRLDQAGETPQQNSSAINELEKVGSLEAQGDVNHLAFTPTGDKIMTLVENRLNLHDLTEGEPTISASGQLEGKGQTTFGTGAWNPHQNCQTFATVNEHHIRGWDIRTLGKDSGSNPWHIEACSNPATSGSSQPPVRSLDFNPNKQYHLSSAGDDGSVRFWDLRNPKTPIKSVRRHSHWVWAVKFNQFHDQLVLSSSSDGQVILHCLASISSEPHGQLADDDDEHGVDDALADGVLKVFDDHEESVYSVAWSPSDPWTFASLSYDGRMVVNQVPRSVKFKILNLV